MYLNVRVAVLAVLFAFLVPSLTAGQAPSNTNAKTDSNVVACRVLEAHASAEPAVLVVIFHQLQKRDQPRLAALIKENTGSNADVQIGSGPWDRVVIFRLRTCFGRGMMILPSGPTKLKDGDTFRIRFSKQARK